MSIPPIWFLLLYRKRQRLNPPTTDKILARYVRSHDQHLAPLRFL